jgi:hypothetical protein
MVATEAKRRSPGEGLQAPQLDTLTLPIAARWVPSLSRDEARERVSSIRHGLNRGLGGDANRGLVHP